MLAKPAAGAEISKNPGDEPFVTFADNRINTDGITSLFKRELWT